MASTVFPAPSAASKTRYVTTLTSGTSYTVPAGVTYVNATLFGAGGGGGSVNGSGANVGHGGQVIVTNLATTPGDSIAYSIGAGGAGSAGNIGSGSTGGSTTFTGATTAVGGRGGTGNDGLVGTAGYGASNGGGAGNAANIGGAGGAGKIELEHWA